MYGELAEDILERTPERSNDFELSALLEEVVSKLPCELRPSGEAIFAVRTADLEANAEAWIEHSRLGQMGHLIGIYDGMNTALYAYSIIARKCHQLLVGQQPDVHSTTPSERFELASAMFPGLLADRNVAFVLETRKRWAANESEVDLDGPMADIINGFDDRLDGGIASHEAGRLLALRFIVAHEVAHHLLGHTHDDRLGKCEFPGRRVLVEAKAQLKVTDDGDWTYRQQQEMDADAFGLLMLSGWLASPDADESAWATATSGAFVALPVLQDLSKKPRNSLHGNRLTEVSGDYPPLLARIEQLVHLVAAVSQRIDPQSPMNPWGAAGQGLLFGRFLLWSRDNS